MHPDLETKKVRRDFQLLPVESRERCLDDAEHQLPVQKTLPVVDAEFLEQVKFYSEKSNKQMNEN